MKLNPLTKFVTVVVYCILLFSVDSIYVVAGLFVIPFVMYMKHFKISKFIAGFSLFIFIINVIFIEGTLFYKLEYSLKIVLRFLGIVFSWMLFSQLENLGCFQVLNKIPSELPFMGL